MIREDKIKIVLELQTISNGEVDSWGYISSKTVTAFKNALNELSREEINHLVKLENEHDNV